MQQLRLQQIYEIGNVLSFRLMRLALDRFAHSTYKHTNICISQYHVSFTKGLFYFKPPNENSKWRMHDVIPETVNINGSASSATPDIPLRFNSSVRNVEKKSKKMRPPQSHLKWYNKRDWNAIKPTHPIIVQAIRSELIFYFVCKISRQLAHAFGLGERLKCQQTHRQTQIHPGLDLIPFPVWKHYFSQWIREYKKPITINVNEKALYFLHYCQLLIWTLSMYSTCLFFTKNYTKHPYQNLWNLWCSVSWCLVFSVLWVNLWFIGNNVLIDDQAEDIPSSEAKTVCKALSFPFKLNIVSVEYWNLVVSQMKTF